MLCLERRMVFWCIPAHIEERNTAQDSEFLRTIFSLKFILSLKYEGIMKSYLHGIVMRTRAVLVQILAYSL